MILYRTYIGQINCVFTLPANEINNKKLLIFCPGLPGQPENASIMEYFAKEGFTTFFIKYTGTWESGGEFLKRSPEVDIREVVSYLTKHKKITELYNSKQIELNFEEIDVFGSSFGGSVALVAGAKDKNIKKIVALAPIINYKLQCKNPDFEEEDLTRLGKFLSKAYGMAYRVSLSDWNKLIDGEIDLNPSDYIFGLKGKNVLLVQGARDKSVSPKRTKDFFDRIKTEKNDYKLLEESEHLSFTNLPEDPRRYIAKWLLKS